MNNKAFDYAVEVETAEEWDYNEDGEFDEEEKNFQKMWIQYFGKIIWV